MRVPLIAGNWKMYKTAREAAEMIRSLCGQVAEVTGVEVVVCPPFTALVSAIEAASGSRVAVGAQDCFWEKEGAFTGEVSVPMLADLGCRYAIVGHSERRQYFGETDATVDKKIGAVLASGLTCIGCLGETLKAIHQQDQVSITDLIALSVETTLEHIAPAAVFVPTHSGETARRITRFRLPVWIVAVSSQEATCQRLQFSYGVCPVHEPDHPDDWNAYVRDWLQAHEVEGNLVVLTEGPSSKRPETNNRVEIIDLTRGPGEKR